MAKFLCLPTLIFLFTIFTQTIHADSQVVINEIMYDLEGTDEKREWVELFNLGTESVDLTAWRFEENGVQHTLTLKQGEAFVAGGKFALIVDDYDTFLQDNPGFTGTIFDSSFSLSNTGENLKIRDSRDGNIIDEVTYSSDWGASGDRNSLQRKSDGSWVAAAATPGKQNSSEPLPPPSPTPSSTSGSSNKSSSAKSTSSSSKSSPKASPSTSNVKTSTTSSPSVQGVKQKSSPNLLPSESPSPSPTQGSEENSKNSKSSIKVAGILTGAGSVLIGASGGFYFWYYKIRKKSESEDNQEPKIDENS